MRAEASKSPKLNALALAQGADHAVQDDFHHSLGFLERYLQNASNFFCKISLRHHFTLAGRSQPVQQLRLI